MANGQGHGHGSHSGCIVVEIDLNTGQIQYPHQRPFQRTLHLTITASPQNPAVHTVPGKHRKQIAHTHQLFAEILILFGLNARFHESRKSSFTALSPNDSSITAKSCY
jgi:hypothetical protein